MSIGLWSRRRGCGPTSCSKSALPTPARPQWTIWLRGTLHATAADVFRTPGGQPYYLYQHQVEAMELASTGQSFVVTSGTGSGKSLTYFLPIIDSLLRQPATGDRVAALVVYPMNAW